MKLLMIKFLNSHKKKLKIKIIKRNKKNLKNCCAFISVFYCNTIAFSSFFSFLKKANTSRFKLFDMFSWIKCDSHRTICRCGMNWTWNRMSSFCAEEMVASSHKKNTCKLNIWYMSTNTSIITYVWEYKPNFFSYTLLFYTWFASCFLVPFHHFSSSTCFVHTNTYDIGRYGTFTRKKADQHACAVWMLIMKFQTVWVVFVSRLSILRTTIIEYKPKQSHKYNEQHAHTVEKWIQNPIEKLPSKSILLTIGSSIIRCFAYIVLMVFVVKKMLLLLLLLGFLFIYKNTFTEFLLQFCGIMVLEIFHLRS